MSRPTPAELHALTPVIVEISRSALEWFRRPWHEAPVVENKNHASLGGGDFDPVTEADRHIEDRLRAEIGARFPDHSIFGEERGTTGEGRFGWVIDPIDGTRAFVSGQRAWGTLVALTDDGRPIAGWMHQPALDETFVAIDDEVSWTSDGVLRRPQTRPPVALGEGILLSTHPSMFVTPAERAAFERVAEAVRLVRFGGDCTNYGLLTAGFVDLVIENQLEPYDIVPLLPIVTAAGGVVTDARGESPLHGGFVVASANERLHTQVLHLLADLHSSDG